MREIERAKVKERERERGDREKDRANFFKNQEISVKFWKFVSNSADIC